MGRSESDQPRETPQSGSHSWNVDSGWSAEWADSCNSTVEHSQSEGRADLSEREDEAGGQTER